MTDDRDSTAGDSLHSLETGKRANFEAVENTSALEDDSSDPDWTSETFSSTDSDSEDYPLDKRLQQPTEYFQELDSLGSVVCENSMLQFHTVNP